MLGIAYFEEIIAYFCALPARTFEKSAIISPNLRVSKHAVNITVHSTHWSNLESTYFLVMYLQLNQFSTTALVYCVFTVSVFDTSEKSL